MSFVYYSDTLTFGPPLIRAQLDSAARWSSPSLFSSLLSFLSTLPFSDFDCRRLALARIRSSFLQPFFFVYPFSPTAYPLLPPIPQSRFPPSQSYILLDSPEYQGPLATIQASLSYRDSDGPIDTPLANFTAALLALQSAFDALTSFFDQPTYEALRLLVWSPYPPPFSH
jgi:hypothetical protein